MLKKINIHPFTLPLFIILFIVDKNRIYTTLYILIFLHEVAHLAISSLLGQKIASLHLYPWGCMLSLSSIPNLKQGVIIHLAGPLFNLLLFFLGFYPMQNLSLALFNLLPVIPLDGGVIINLLCPKLLFPISILCIVSISALCIFLKTSLLLPLVLTFILYLSEKNRLNKNICAKVIEKSKEKLYNTIDKI